MAEPRVVVVGGGIGGLAAAIRLRARGCAVTVCERRDEFGGKLSEYVHEGFTFETGPSLLTLPELIDACFAAAGTRLADEVDLVRLDPICTYHWPDGARLSMPADPEDAAAAIDDFHPGAGPAWTAFLARGRRIWETSLRTFFAGPMESPLRLLRRMESPRDLHTIDALRTLDRAARQTFADPRLVQLIDRYATYSGSSPYKAPATLACIPAVEAFSGAWYVRGGLARLRDAFVRIAEKSGVALRAHTEIARILHDGTAVSGVTTTSGVRIPADVVIANVDALHLYRDLLDDGRTANRVEATERSSSGVVVLAAVTGTTSGLGHHNIIFSPDYRSEFDQLFTARTPATNPTVYACVSSVTDATQAPPGSENWFLLVNAPAGEWSGDAASYAERILNTVRPVYGDVAARSTWQHVITPSDIAREFRTAGGAIYGTASNGRRAAFRRPANRGPRRGLYLVGGSAHPGGGLPLVTQSGAIVEALVAQDCGLA